MKNFRIWLALLASLLAICGSGAEPSVRETPRAEIAARVGDAAPFAVQAAAPALFAPTRDGGSLDLLREQLRPLGRVLREAPRSPDWVPPVFLAAAPDSYARGNLPSAPGSARHLAAMRDGTLSSRSNGIPPPIA